jgi:hypothetical protein
MNGMTNCTSPELQLLIPSSDSMAPFDASPLGVGSFADFYGDGSDASPLFASDNSLLADLSGSFDGQTVSPADVSRNSSFLGASGSVPNSAALTNLTSPDMNSPYLEYDTSPMFGGNNVNDSTGWFSLFPDASLDKTANTVVPVNMERNPSHQSIGSSSNDSPLVMGASVSGKSPHDKASPNSAHRRSTSGVSKRRRAGPLKTVADYDLSDKAAMKRLRNTEAARVSRQRKVEEKELLEGRINELKEWQSKASQVLRSAGYKGDLLDTLEQ